MIIFSYLPLKRKDWDSVLCKRRALYEVELKAEFKLPLDLEADVRRRDGVGEEMADNASRCLDSGEFTGGREEGSVPMEGGTESAGLTDSINMSWYRSRRLQSHSNSLISSIVCAAAPGSRTASCWKLWRRTSSARIQSSLSLTAAYSWHSQIFCTSTPS